MGFKGLSAIHGRKYHQCNAIHELTRGQMTGVASVRRQTDNRYTVFQNG